MIYSNQHNSLKWNYKNADWKGFAMACDNKFSYDMVSDNIEETNSTLTKELINIAGDYIPVKKFNNKKKSKTMGSKLYKTCPTKEHG
jgi:NAD dependent epimerase/dehydratase family enzyme